MNTIKYLERKVAEATDEAQRWANETNAAYAVWKAATEQADSARRTMNDVQQEHARATLERVNLLRKTEGDPAGEWYYRAS